MEKIKIISYILLSISVLMILYALIFTLYDWIVYAIAIVFIPLFIVSFGISTMAKPIEDEKEERDEEPFIGY